MLSQYRALSRNTITVSATIGLVLIAYFAWSPVLPLYLRKLGASEVEIGIAFSIFTLANAVPALFGGILSDRIGRKWVITAPGVLLVPLYLFAGISRDWWLVVAALAATFFLGAIQYPAMQALVSESDENQRAGAFAMLEFFVLGAAIVGPLIGSFLLDTFGVNGLLLAHGVTVIPATLARARWLHETHHKTHRAEFDPKRWRAAITGQGLWITAANALFMLALGLSVEGPFGTLLANDVWKLDDQQIEWVWAVGAAVALLGVWLGGKADQWGGRRVWVVSALGMAVGLIGWGLSAHWQIGIGFLFGTFVFYETIFIVAQTLLAHHTTPITRSFVFGFTTTVGGFATAAGPVVGAWLTSFSSLAAPFLAAAVACVVSIAFVSFIREGSTGRVSTQPSEGVSVGHE